MAKPFSRTDRPDKQRSVVALNRCVAALACREEDEHPVITQLEAGTEIVVFGVDADQEMLPVWIGDCKYLVFTRDLREATV